ncbi:MAG TPA: sigma-70 family RNA polymerase sigma factor [Acidimicrobiales bacterium]|nr:sigma-70 family RNA polymerase sigma factor [Acidimicrobiales bacterium]
MVDPRDDTPGTAPGPPAGRLGDAPGDGGRAAEDASWVVAARGGDDEAFGRLFDRWFDPVYDVAWRIVRDRDTAADVAQDVFLAAWQGLDGLEQPASFGGWVRRIARNRALNRLDRERRSVPDDERAAAALDRSAPDVDLTAAMDEREQHDLVWAAARALGERDASLLDLHLRHGLGAGAIADELGVTANNAHQLLHRLKGKLAGAIRAWVLWRAGEGRCAGLDRAIAGAGLVSFGAEAVRVIDRHARACDGCAERQQLRLAPEALFAAMPIMAAPPLLKAEAAAALGQAGVPMAGSAAAAPAAGGGSGAPGSGAADGPEPGGVPVRRVALVAVAVVVLLVVAGVAGLAARGGGDGDTAGAAGPTAGEESPASSAAREPGAGSVKPSPGSGSAKPAPAPPGDTTATTAVPGEPGTTAGSGTTAPTGDPAPPPPPGQPPPPPPDPDPPTIGGFRATAGEQCGATPSQRLVQLAWQSAGGESATISGPGGTSTHEASGATTRCVPVPTGTFTLTVTGPGGTATATTSAG